MSNPGYGWSTDLTNMVYKKFNGEELETPVTLLQLQSLYPELLEIREDTENVNMLLCDEVVELTREDDTIDEAVPVDYVGSTPVHF